MHSERHIVLLGAGNANLVILRAATMKPFDGATLTLITPDLVVPYSGMVPGYIAGQYSKEEIEIDLVTLCARAKASLIHDRATSIEGRSKLICFETRPKIPFDILSICVGSTSSTQSAIPLKPLGSLLPKLKEIKGSYHLAIVGGGAGGFELAASLKECFRSNPDFRVTLIQRRKLGGEFGPRIRNHFRNVLNEKSVELVENTEAIQDGENYLCLVPDGSTAKDDPVAQRIRYDGVLWTTTAKPVSIQSDLQTFDGGFFSVDSTLKCLGFSDIYASGDCAHFSDHPLPKAGVYSVREGEFLVNELKRRLEGSPSNSYRPQRHFLLIFNASDGTGILRYIGFGFRGRLALKIKRWIDSRWMRSFHPRLASSVTAMSVASIGLHQDRCGGCASKISSADLNQMLDAIDTGNSTGVIIGKSEQEDVAVVRAPSEALLVTNDYFRTFLSDDYLFGRISVLHALNDIYSKGGIPKYALCTAVVANTPHRLSKLSQLMAGVSHQLEQEATCLVGGHSAEGSESAIGLTAIGEPISKDAATPMIWPKRGLVIGDDLILTKPIGTGILMAALRFGRCSNQSYSAAMKSMLQSHRAARDIGVKFPITACTDISGFGLIGHLIEMCDGINVSIELKAADVPLLPGVLECLKSGVTSSLHPDNLIFSTQILHTAPPWAFDPQTSGGLLFAVPPSHSDQITGDLVVSGYMHATIVGRVTPRKARPIEMV